MSNSSHFSSPKPSNLPIYQPPSLVFNLLPRSWVPYAELTRLHKPIGVLVIYLPYLFGLLFASIILSPPAPPLSVIQSAMTLLLASFVLRSAGCTWNDVVDYKFDQKATRCRLRPIARGAVSPIRGSVFFAALMALWLDILWSTSPDTLLFVGPKILMVILYPYAKRYTDYPQLVLGVTLALGLCLGSMASGVNAMILCVENTRAATGLGSLFVAYVMWTAVYDTIYGFQDLQDDKKSGVRSMAVRWQHVAKELLVVLVILMVLSLGAMGWAIEAGMGYYLGACGGSAVVSGAMIWMINLGDTDECAWWFKYGTLIVGVCMSEGLVAEYVSRVLAPDMIRNSSSHVLDSSSLQN